MIRVLLAADVRLYRDGLVHALSGREAITVVGAVASCEEAIAGIRDLCPHVLVMDTGMPGSLAAMRLVAATATSVKIVALGLTEIAANVIECAEAGIDGYVPREGSVEDLVAAIESAARGELRCSPVIAASLLRRVAALSAHRSATSAPEAVLTGREREIARLLQGGLSNKEIAARLSIEVATVKNHVHNILEKLHVSRRGEAAARLRSDARI